MALELRPNCEWCDKDLPPAATDARICSYECTFCADCVERHLQNVCPNCGGGFTATADPPGDRVASRALGGQASAVAQAGPAVLRAGGDRTIFGARSGHSAGAALSGSACGHRHRLPSACLAHRSNAHDETRTGEAERDDQATERAGGDGGSGDGGHRRGVELPQAGDRAERARAQVAADLELPEVAGHDLRRGRGVRQGRGRDDRRQVADPGVRQRARSCRGCRRRTR